MLRRSLLKLLKKPFYGWWILAAGTVSMTFQGGLYFYGFSVFFVPLINEFGWTRAALSGVFSLSRMESGLIGPIEGLLTDRFGPRKLMFAGMIMMGLGFILLSQVHSIVLFYIVFLVLVSFGTSLGTQTPVATAIGNWFVRRRSFAFGIYMTGVGIGGLFVPLLTWLVNESGWRTAAAAIGVFVLIVGIPLSLMMRHKPEQYGYLPDGDTAPPRAVSPAIVREKRAPVRNADFTMMEAAKTSSFWLLHVAYSLRIAATNGLTLHLIPYLMDVGFDSEAAALVLAATGIVSIVGRAGIGWLGDIFDKRYVLAISTVLVVVGIVTLLGVHNLWTAILFIIVFSPPYGGAIPLSHAIRGEYFGRSSFGAIAGLGAMVQIIGTVGGPLVAGWMYDLTGSYRMAFMLFIVLCSISVVMVLLARRPVKPVTNDQ